MKNRNENPRRPDLASELISMSQQLHSYGHLLKGYRSPESQNEDLAGLGLALEKLARQAEEFSSYPAVIEK